MDSFGVRKLVEEVLENGRKKPLFYRKLADVDKRVVADALWDYAQESKSSYDELNILRDKIKELSNKSGQRVRCLEVLPDRRALVKLGPVTEELVVSPNVTMRNLKPGCEVLVIGSKEGRMLAEIREPCMNEGRFSKVARKLDDKRVILEEGGTSLIMRVVNDIKCDVGDEVRYDLDAQMVLEVLTHSKDSTFSLVEKPVTTFDDVKGLEEEKRFLRERIVYPAVYKDKFKKYGLKAVRGGLMHGPPGCGKTMIASAIFNEMAKIQDAEHQGEGFFVVNGPEMLSKWAGNTEEAIRNLFKEARKTARKMGFPSVIFWDEIESITAKRKDSATYTPEKTVVPTLLTELQGVRDTGDVILIGASNRPDLIDPALMRPGRLGDVILEIPRPNKEGAVAIIESSLRGEETPPAIKLLLSDGLVQKLAEHIYDNKTPLARAKTQSGKIIDFMRQEMVNGALFAQVGDELIRRACMAEIYSSDPPTMADAIKMLDNIFLNQLGVLDASVKNGFIRDTKDIVMDVSLNG